MYALAAGAAGVAVLCVARSAEAKIVYTPANVNIVTNGGLIDFDLNHDGIPDFGLSNKFMSGGSTSVARLRVVQTRQANEIIAGQPCEPAFLCAAALPKGAKIGRKGQFQQDPGSGLVMIELAVCGSCYDFGPWLNVKQAYLGLKFVIRGKVHFGWARVRVKVGIGTSIAATLTGYAYETVPHKSIVAGAIIGPDDADPAASLNTRTPLPATLGTLALGVPGLSIWRREDSVGARQ
jgi:hypothetical protein